MFARIAGGYDRANRVLSMGIDKRWRARVVRAAGLGPGSCALDVCAGTGDLTVALAQTGARVVGADFCVPMLERALPKGAAATKPLGYVGGDTMALPFADGVFDAVTVAFGIRNVADPVAGLREMFRVVKPGGRVLVLEFSRPRVPVWRTVYGAYFKHVLPRCGALVSGSRDGSYRYLHDSVMAFPEREAFLGCMREAGGVDAHFAVLTGGVACLYEARAQEAASEGQP